VPPAADISWPSQTVRADVRSQQGADSSKLRSRVISRKACDNSAIPEIAQEAACRSRLPVRAEQSEDIMAMMIDSYIATWRSSVQRSTGGQRRGGQLTAGDRGEHSDRSVSGHIFPRDEPRARVHGGLTAQAHQRIHMLGYNRT